MVGTADFDYAVAIGGIVALIIVFICYKIETAKTRRQEKSWREDWFDFPEPPGLTKPEKIQWLQKMCEAEINDRFPHSIN